MPSEPLAGAPHRTATLLLFKGHPATGKSRLATALAEKLGWPLIDKDDVKDGVVDLPDGNALAYTILWQIVARQLSLRINVIVDSPLSYPDGYATGRSLAIRFHARLLVVETALSDAAWRERLDARAPGESTHKIRGWQQMQEQLARYDDCWRYPVDPAHHMLVDTAKAVDDNVRLIVTRLSAAP